MSSSGLPNLDTKSVLEFPNIKIARYDERFTSALAHQTMLMGGLKKKARANKDTVDMVSATIILQDYMSSIGK